MPKPKYTLKQEMWAHEYIADRNATQAAIRAGYSQKSARQIGQQNLSKPVLRELIDQLQSEATQKAGLTAQQVLNELANIALFDPGECYDEDGSFKAIKDLPESVRRNIASIESVDDKSGSKSRGVTQRIKFHNKGLALTNLAKHFKLLTENYEHSGKGGGPIQIDIRVEHDAALLSDAAIEAIAREQEAAAAAAKSTERKG